MEIQDTANRAVLLLESLTLNVQSEGTNDLQATAAKLHHLLEIHERLHRIHSKAHEDFLCDLQNNGGLLEHSRDFQKRAIDYWLFRNNRYVPKLAYLLAQATSGEQALTVLEKQAPKTLEEFERNWLAKQNGELAPKPATHEVLTEVDHSDIAGDDTQGE